MTGSRALDETRVGAAAGLVSGAMLVLSGYYASLTVVQLWWFGIALPAVVAGFAARYYTHARQSWTTFWSQREQSKYGLGTHCPVPSIPLMTPGILM